MENEFVRLASFSRTTNHNEKTGKTEEVLFALDTKGRMWQSSCEEGFCREWYPVNMPIESDWHE